VLEVQDHQALMVIVPGMDLGVVVEETEMEMEVAEEMEEEEEMVGVDALVELVE